jgi:hypothetical protein
MHKLVHEMAKTFGDDAPLPTVYRRTLIPLLNLAKPVSTSLPTPVSFSPTITPTNNDPMMKALLDEAMKRQGY